MNALTTHVRNHPIAAYFLLTFTISWSGVLLVMGLGGVEGTSAYAERLFPVALLWMLMGPSMAGLLLTALLHGRAGLSGILGKIKLWRVGVRWYAFALLAGPVLLAVVLLGLSLISPVFLPGVFHSDAKTALLLFGLAAGLVTGFLEELGWTGFATPEVRRRFGILSTGLFIGVFWGAWHFLPNVWVSGRYAGDLSVAFYLSARFLTLIVGGLPAFRVLMVWVYDRTGSLLVVMLMHASLTAATIILEPTEISGTSLLVYDLASAALNWILVAVLLFYVKPLSRPTVPGRAEKLHNG